MTIVWGELARKAAIFNPTISRLIIFKLILFTDKKLTPRNLFFEVSHVDVVYQFYGSAGVFSAKYSWLSALVMARSGLVSAMFLAPAWP